MDPEGEPGYEYDYPADHCPGLGGGQEGSIDAERGSVSIQFSENNQAPLISGRRRRPRSPKKRNKKSSHLQPPGSSHLQPPGSSHLQPPDDFKGEDIPDGPAGKEETRLKELIQDEQKEWNISEIEAAVTAKKLCSCRDPVNMAFKLNKRLKELAETSTENTQSLDNLADKVADFAFELLDQVRTKEEIGIKDKSADRYGSLFSKMTKDAIIYGQKKFVSHPFLFKRVKMRWQKGFPFMSQGIAGAILWLLFIVLETALTPLLLPMIAFVSYKDQVKQSKKNGDGDGDGFQKEEQVQMSEMMSPNGGDEANELSKTAYSNFTERYFAYLNTPKIIFIKTELMKLVFIVLHCRICIMGSSVMPSTEEYLVFLFFLAVFLSEYEQVRTSAPEIRYKMYFRDMWNWIDLLTLFTYFVIIILRVIVISRGGDAHHNRLLEIANYCYGFNAMFLILRLSSILELSSVFGPLQLALFQMCVDLMTILVQFAFVVTAFTMALIKSYSAELSYLAPNDNQPSNHTSGVRAYCFDSPLKCLYKAARQLIWSVFGLMESKDLESNSGVTSEIVGLLYLIFMILSVIMLINILVALLTTTYEKYRTNWETEWKFGLAVVEEQYQRRHCIVIPYNLLTYPILRCFSGCYKDARNENAEGRQANYIDYLQKHFFPVITERYEEKYNGEFPLSVDEKLDKLLEKLKMMQNEGSQENEKNLREVFTQILD